MQPITLFPNNIKFQSKVSNNHKRCVGVNIFSAQWQYLTLKSSLHHSVQKSGVRNFIIHDSEVCGQLVYKNHISDNSWLMGRAPEPQTTRKDMASHPSSHLKLNYSNLSCNLPQAVSQNWKLEKHLFSTYRQQQI